MNEFPGTKDGALVGLNGFEAPGLKLAFPTFIMPGVLGIPVGLNSAAATLGLKDTASTCKLLY
jgi:hypothetical protein